MKKFLMISTSTLTLALLLAQVFFPDSPLVWMASEGVVFAALRAVIVIALTILLFSEVVGIVLPKPLLMAGAAGLCAFATVLLFSDRLSAADGVIFMETAIVMLLEVLEPRPRLATAFQGHPVGKLGVGNDFVKIS